MLNMKHTWKAVMTLGLALLLGPGLAMAQTTIVLDRTVATEDQALTYAQETLGASVDRQGRKDLTLPEVVNLVVHPRRAIAESEEVYLRINLSGAHFGANPAIFAVADSDAADPGTVVADVEGGTPVTSDTGPWARSSGGADQSFAVLSVGAVTAGGALAVQIPGAGTEGEANLKVTAATGPITVDIKAYSNADDALDQERARSSFAGSGTIINLQSGLNAEIKRAPNAVASVDSGFVRFLAGTREVGMAPLGWLNVEEATVTGGLRTAATGAVIDGDPDNLTPDNQRVVPGAAKVRFDIMGDLNIGAFHVVEEEFAPTDTAEMMPMATCPGGAADRIDQGDLVDSQGDLLIDKDGVLPSGVESASTMLLDPDKWLLCVNVDVTGPMSNMARIPEGDYRAVAYLDNDGASATQRPREVTDGPLASIERNGASVAIPYLTTSEKHNQRLIIVNRGSRSAVITDFDITTEDGTEYELTDTVQAAIDAGLFAVPAMSSLTRPVRELIEITGNSRRVAAALSFAATGRHLSVATTQVNLGDSSTDTVVYEVTD